MRAQVTSPEFRALSRSQLRAQSSKPFILSLQGNEYYAHNERKNRQDGRKAAFPSRLALRFEIGYLHLQSLSRYADDQSSFAKAPEDKTVDVVQLVRMLDCDSGGRGFEPRHSPFN